MGNKETKRHIVILILAVIFIFFLTYYIAINNKEVEEDKKIVEQKVNIIKENNKEYISTTKIDIDYNKRDIKIFLKFYGETLKSGTKVISAEVYFGEEFKGEFIYNKTLNSNLNYNQLVLKTTREELRVKDMVYKLGEYLVLQISNDTGAKLLMFNDKEEIIDVLNYYQVTECKNKTLNNHEVFKINVIDNYIYYYEMKEENLDEYKLTLTKDGFEKIKVGSFLYDDYCKDKDLDEVSKIEG